MLGCAVCRSWLGRLASALSTPEEPVSLPDADLAFLNGLFEQFVDAGLALVRSKCQEGIATVDINLVMSLTKLLQVMHHPTFVPTPVIGCLACVVIEQVLLASQHV